MLQPIQLTEIGQYDLLKKQIIDHQAHLNGVSDQTVSITSAAQDWHQTIYVPLVSIIEKGGLIRFFPERTLADLSTSKYPKTWRNLEIKWLT